METLACAAPVANNNRLATATRRERILLWPPGLIFVPHPVPPLNMPEFEVGFQSCQSQIVAFDSVNRTRRKDERDIPFIFVAATRLRVHERGTRASCRRYRSIHG